MIPFTDDGIVEVTSSRVVPQAPDVVWRRLVESTIDLSPADRALALGAAAVTKAPAAHHAGVYVSADVRAVAIQGGWWYRGVNSVSAAPGGARVTYTVVNVARGWSRWLAHWFHAPAHQKQARWHTGV